MKKLLLTIIIIAGIAILVFAPLWRADTLNRENLRWYHSIDLQNEANGPTVLHIANECNAGTVELRPDGVYCYNATTTAHYISIFDMLLRGY